ncbi:MAG TPA: hypothetical protein VLA92_00855 [Candidatus Saccharimonadales bacterium]|nr:hypothetical protein [Candidatus Saccharimonadales bacterium]
MTILSVLKQRLRLLLIALVALLAIWFCTLSVSRIAEESERKAVGSTQNQKHQNKVAPTEEPAIGYVFPDGAQKLFPGNRLVALYGSPGASRLGVLGETSVDQAVARAKELAAQYQPFSAERVMPTFEIIATVASSSATPNNDYSNELDAAMLAPWVQAAKAAGVYVVLDLQPGRSDFLSQAKLYETLLREPNVGLALDPEWRLQPGQVHMQQIGSVDVSEVNATSTWLADITAQGRLPQKLFLVHQFRNSMISGRERLDTSRSELAYVIQMDGNGAQSTKLATWQTIRQNAPAQVLFGWKNFYDEDLPVLSPEQSMALDPKPWYISYQ